MMKKGIISVFIATLACSAACSMFASNDNGKPQSKPLLICPDDSVVKVMGDSIASIVFNPKTVMLYELDPSAKVGDNDRTIGGVKVKQEVGKVQKDYYPIVLFMLSDSLSYSDEIIVPARPFVPRMALEFKQKKESVFILFSFGSREISAVKNGKELWHKHINDSRKYVRFFYNITKDKELEETLKNWWL